MPQAWIGIEIYNIGLNTVMYKCGSRFCRWSDGSGYNGSCVKWHTDPNDAHIHAYLSNGMLIPVSNLSETHPAICEYGQYNLFLYMLWVRPTCYYSELGLKYSFI